MIDGKLTMWTVMDHPEDFPDHWVVVLDWVDGRTPARDPGRWFARDLEDARAIIHANDPGANVRILRDPGDVPCIVETWC